MHRAPPCPGLFRWLARTAWTHVGLALRGPEDPEPLLWEAVRGTAPRHARGAACGAHDRVCRQDERALSNRPLTSEHCQRLDALRREMAEGRARLVCSP